MSDQPPALRPLTAFRFLAALAVFCHHMHDYCLAEPRLVKIYQSVLFEGYAGVTFFFVLSGFILTYNYNGLFKTLRGREIWKFYAARFARIYPVHLLTFLAMVPLVYPEFLAAPGIASLHAGSNLFLVQSFIPRTDFFFSYNAPSWSLSNELFFYALLPLLLWSLHSLHLTRPIRSAGLLVVCLAVALGLTWVWRRSPHFDWLCYINPLFRVADFAAGIALCFTFLGLRKARPATLGRIPATLLEMGGLVAVSVLVYYAQAVPFPVRLGSYYTAAMAAIILIFAFQGGYLSALVSTRFFCVLGEMSFSFYMLHIVVLRYLQPYGPKLHLDRCRPAAIIAITFCLTLVLSALCYYGFERPMRERVKGWLVRSSAKRDCAHIALPPTPRRQAA
jgi:peptidoglycan/LPS O-acetylase OafA/YrhL